MQRTNEIKTIMRQLKGSNKFNRAVNEALNAGNMNEAEVETENDASDTDLVLARLEDILSRFEKVLSANAEGGEEEAPAEGGEEAPAENEEEEVPAENEGEEEAPAENEGGEEEEETPAEESYRRKLERRIATLERIYTESQRRARCSKFRR